MEGVGTPGSRSSRGPEAGDVCPFDSAPLSRCFRTSGPANGSETRNVGAPNAPESRRPGAAGPRLSQRPVGRLEVATRIR